jgi:cell division protein FtsW
VRNKNKIKKKNQLDKQFLFLSLTLTVIGIIAIADASAPIAIREFSDKFYFVKQQIYSAIIGLVLLIIISKLNYKYWGKYASVLFFLTIFVLILVLIPGLGISALGAKRRIFLGPASFQPSEFLKLALAIYIAKVTEKEKKIVSYLFPILISAFLIMLQPDLGTTLIVLGVGFVQMFIAGLNLLQLIALSVGGLGIVSLLVLFSDYRKERLLTYFTQTRDPLGKSYHIRQILITLGSGGLFGVGLGNSRQKYLFLPETATDSIFAVIAEELGFIGSTILILVFMYFIYRGIKIALMAPDVFSKVLSGGLIAWIGGQTFLNIAAMVSLIPLTGIPLPFVSYGGSSLISILVACGILLNISKYGKSS